MLRLDWSYVYERLLQPYAIFVAGITFGAAWWIWADALTYSIAVLHSGFNPLWLLPGIVATLAVGLMNVVSREDLEYAYNDDAAVMRSKLMLFLSYVVSVGAVAGAVAILITIKSQGDTKLLYFGASGILQTSLILASGMIAWFFHQSGDSADYTYL